MEGPEDEDMVLEHRWSRVVEYKMSNRLSLIRVEGDLGARKARGNLSLPLFGEDQRLSPVRKRPKGNRERFTITSESTTFGVRHE